MPIVQLLVIIIVVGVLLWLVNSIIPMDPTIKKVLNVVVVLLLVVWLLNVFGIFDMGGTIGTGRGHYVR